jgi:hypothetical protein
MRAFTRLLAAGLACLVIGTFAVRAVQADNDKQKKKDINPIGAWFGVARPCPANAATDSALHVAFCQSICGICPSTGLLPPEVPMMPTLLADGTVLADDAGELSLYHTTAHGKWAVSEDDGLPNRPGTTRFKATFLWLGQTGPTNQLDNSVRPRFVTYFDSDDPDRMIGFIQPYFFPIAAGGIVIPAPPTDPLSGNHIPAVDPLGSLPAGCQLDKGCLGTYHFVIRRIKAE